VGSSNAQRLGAALIVKGKHCDILNNASWTISRASVEHLASHVRRVITQEDPDLVIFFLNDNSTYYARGEDGSCNLPKKDQSGKFHIEGELVISSRDTQAAHFAAMRPLLEAVGKKKCLWVAPMPRYLLRGCCDNPSHITNRSTRYYKDEMDMQLDRYKWHMKEYIKATGKRNFKILDPNYDLRSMDEAEVWGDDPVHPRERAYQKIADGVLTMNACFTPAHPAPVNPRTNYTREETAPRRGRGGGRGYGRPPPDQQQQSSIVHDNRRGRQYPPGHYEGRGRGGHQDHRARPY
jgi:hypothetical protein